MPETLCPACGHSPIPPDSAACPSCDEPFDFIRAHKRGERLMMDRMMDHVDIEPTMHGGILTGALSVHPGPAATVFFAGAFVWFLRAGQVLGELRDPAWTYGLVLVDLVVGLMLLLNLGPSRMLAQGGALLQLCAALVLSTLAPREPVHLAYVAHAAVAFAMVVGEPGHLRRRVGLGLGLGASLLALIFLALSSGLEGAEGGAYPRIEDRALGYELELPPGWRRLKRSQLAPHLRLPEVTHMSNGGGFGHLARGYYGALWVERSKDTPLTVGCQVLLRALGPGATSGLSSRRAPLALPSESVVHDLNTTSGGTGLFACGQLADGRRIGLIVVTPPSDAAISEQLLHSVGAGLALH